LDPHAWYSVFLGWLEVKEKVGFKYNSRHHQSDFRRQKRKIFIVRMVIGLSANDGFNINKNIMR
jgi:hypothetical protein